MTPMRLIAAALCAAVLLAAPAAARDLDGRYANSPLKGWFDGLQSNRGMCCSFADGVTVEDPDWGTDGAHYWVNVEGEKIVVPDEALVSVPNKFGRAVVWPFKDSDGKTQIRCFMPGAGT